MTNLDVRRVPKSLAQSTRVVGTRLEGNHSTAPCHAVGNDRGHVADIRSDVEHDMTWTQIAAQEGGNAGIFAIGHQVYSAATPP